MIIRPFTRQDTDTVVQLWQQCGLLAGHNDPLEDIRRKLNVNPDLFLVGSLDRTVMATIMGGYEGHRGWLNYLAVSPSHRNQGYGRRIVQEAEQRIRRLGAPKINLQVRSSNSNVIAFYKSLGYHTDEVVSMGKRL